MTFYPLDHDEFLLLNNHLRDAEIRTYLYLMTLNPFPDSSMEIDTSRISEQLGLTRRTVQRAVKRLQELGFIEIEITKFKYKKVVHGASSRLYVGDPNVASSKNGDPNVVQNDPNVVQNDPNVVQNDPNVADTCLKPLHSKDYEVPHTIQTYSDFIKTLSKDERESFLEFGKKKAAELPKFPTLPLKWIEKNFEDVRSQWFQTRDENKNQNQKYNFAAYSQAQHQMWYQQLQTVVVWTIQSGDRARLEQFLRDDFYSSWFDWAKTARDDVREFLASNPIPI
jgi:DNA-binding Lrp family transcriptional regulator